MDALFLANLTSPPLLFFFLGVLAVLFRSDLEIPTQFAKALSLYLLFAIGLKGGVALAQSDLDARVVLTLAAALLLATIIPLWVFFATRRLLASADAAALAATYGSISAVTFVTCAGYLDAQGIAWSGYLVAAMALMESPAIIIGILLYRLYGEGNGGLRSVNWRELIHEACFNGSVFLILGSLAIGWIAGQEGTAPVKALTSDLFIGVLCIFLLDMGIVSARRLKDLQTARKNVSAAYSPMFLIPAALVLPLINAALAGSLAYALKLTEGDALLLIILGASASYIAVPAALRLALPSANPSLYLPLSLAVTFPFNLMIGIPVYHLIVRWVMTA